MSMPKAIGAYARLAPIVGLMGAMASFQLGATSAERLFPAVGAPGAAALRILVSAILLAAVRRPWRGLTVRGPWGGLIAYGLALGAMNTLFYMSLRTLPLGIAVAIEFIGPLGVAMAASRRPMDLLWVALAAGGLLLLLPLGIVGPRIDPAGAILALAAGGCWALYIIFGRKAGEAHGSRATGLGVIIAALVFVPPQIAIQGATMFNPKVIPLALAVGFLSSALPYSLEMYALTRLPTRVFGTLMSLEPAVGALAGALLLGQTLGLVQWGGILAVMAAAAGAAVTGAAHSEAPTE
jgi:inner membrane transporter RhtA